MAGKKGKKKAPSQTESIGPSEIVEMDEKRKSVLGGVEHIRTLNNNKKVNNHQELTEWLDEADEWLIKLDDWELNRELLSKCPDLKGLISETFCALHDRYEELDQKRQDWEDRCSFNLVHLYPTNGIELTSDQYCKMFDSNIKDFDEWADISEKKISLAVNEFEEETNIYYDEREYERKQLQQWKLNFKNKMNDEISDLKELVEKVYDQNKIEDIRIKLMRDLFVDQLPQFLRQKVLQSDSIDECTDALKPAFEEFRRKHQERDDQRKLVDQCADLYIIFMRNLFSDIECETDLTAVVSSNNEVKPNVPKSTNNVLKGSAWWVLPGPSSTSNSNSTTTSNKPDKSTTSKETKPDIDETKRLEIIGGIETVKSILRQRPKNYKQLTLWCNKASDWIAKMENWTKDSKIMACDELKLKLTTVSDLLSEHYDRLQEREADWQDYSLYMYNMRLPKMGIQLDETQYNDFLFNSAFGDNDFEIDYSIVSDI